MTILQTFLTGRINPFSYYSLPIFFEALQSLIKKLSINANRVPRIISKSIDSILMEIQICILICMGSFSIVLGKWSHKNEFLRIYFRKTHYYQTHFFIKSRFLCVVDTLLSLVCYTPHSFIYDRSSRHNTEIKEGSFIYAWQDSGTILQTLDDGGGFYVLLLPSSPWCVTSIIVLLMIEVTCIKQ